MGNSISPRVGDTTGTPYYFLCPNGTYVTKFSGRSGIWNDGIAATCSDGTDSPWFGGTTGGQWQENFPDGFTGLAAARGGLHVDQLQFTRSDGSAGAIHGGSGGTPVTWAGCSPNTRIAGVSGTSDAYLNSIQFICQPKLSTGVPVTTVPPVTTPPVTTPPPTPVPPVTAPAASSAVLYFFIFIVILFIIVGVIAMRRQKTGGDEFIY